MGLLHRISRLAMVTAVTLAITPVGTSSAYAGDGFKIEEAKWDHEKNRIL